LDADPDRVRLALTEAVPDFLARLLRGLTAARPEEIRAAAAARLAGRGSSGG
jgi:hypothetical protein